MAVLFSNPGEALEITMHKACACTLDSRWRHENAKSPYSRLYLIRKGDGILTTKDGQEIRLRANVAVLVPAECEFSYRCTHLEKLFFHVSVLRPDKYDAFAGIDRLLALTLETSEYEEIEKALLARDIVSAMRLDALVLTLLLRFVDRYAISLPLPPAYSEPVRATIAYVMENTRITLRARDVASALFLSESKLRNLFRTETGIPLGRYIDDLVFMKAKKMLAQKENSIAGIAAALGFCDAFYFSRRFKEKVGRTPTAYRLGIL